MTVTVDTIVRRVYVWLWPPAALAIVVWLGFTAFQVEARRGCTAFPACSPAQFIAHDPSCVLDPTCASPLASPAAGSDDASWQGSALILDPELIRGNPLSTLAPLNYVAFSAIMALLVCLAARRIRQRARRDTLIRVLAVFWALEIARWLLTADTLARAAEYSRFASDPMTFALLAVFLLPMACAIGLGLRRPRA
jgi:hypothetical protein